MASFGSLGRLTACPRCKGRNGVVWFVDASGPSRVCLYCGWYGYGRAGSDGDGRISDAAPGEPQVRGDHAEPKATAAQ